jgi:hypothetical protein
MARRPLGSTCTSFISPRSMTIPGEGDRGQHVGDAGAAGDHPGPVAVVRAVPDLGGLVSALVLGRQDLAPERVAQLDQQLVLPRRCDGMTHRSHSLLVSGALGRDARVFRIVRDRRGPHIGHTP